MCLLTKINKELDRESFEAKKKTYAESRIGITNELSDFPAWNREAINQRQARMAERAVEAWRFQ